MKIDVLGLKNETAKLNKLIENYETNYLNLYNEISKATSHWQDNNSINFFNSTGFDKLKVQTNINELKEVSKVYNYLIEKYQILGNKIEYDLKNYDALLKIFESYISKLESVINLYNNLDLSVGGTEVQMLLKQKDNIINIKDNILIIKESVIDTVNQITETEKEVKLKISQLTIELLGEKDISEYI